MVLALKALKSVFNKKNMKEPNILFNQRWSKKLRGTQHTGSVGE